MAAKARTLKDALQRQRAVSVHEELVTKMQQWAELMAEWPKDAGGRGLPLEAASSSFAKRVHSLCTLGIPPKIRGAVWPLLIGNALNTTREQFDSYKDEVETLRRALASSTHCESALAAVQQTPPRGSLNGRLPEMLAALSNGSSSSSSSNAGISESPSGGVFMLNSSLGGALSSTAAASTPPRTLSAGAVRAELALVGDCSKHTERKDEAEDSKESISQSSSSSSLAAMAILTSAVAAAAGAGEAESNSAGGDATSGGAGGDTTQTVTSLLRWDLPRTFPTLKFFHDDGFMRVSLERVLYTYVLYAPETGYVQGMSFVAAMLLLNLDEADAFACLANLLYRRGLSDFISLQREHVDNYVACFDHFFQQTLPLLFNHLREECVSSEMFLLDWYLAIFTKALPLEAAARVWDCYLAEGELFGFKICLGILRLFAAKLCNLRTEGIMSFLVHLPEDVDSDKLLASAQSIAISQSHFERVRTSLSGSGPPPAPSGSSSKGGIGVGVGAKEKIDEGREKGSPGAGGEGFGAETAVGGGGRAKLCVLM